MSAAAGAIVVLFLLLSLGAGLVLYRLVRAEGADRDVLSRQEAERAARRDTQDRDE